MWSSFCANDLRPLQGSDLESALVGMCPNEIRKLTWDHWNSSLYFPLTLSSSVTASSDEPLTILIRLHAVTTAKNYSIFDPISRQDFGTVFDLLSDHIGVNAVDEWGQSPLIISVINRYTPLIATLLNAHHPKVDVNYTKPVSDYNRLTLIVVINHF